MGKRKYSPRQRMLLIVEAFDRTNALADLPAKNPEGKARLARCKHCTQNKTPRVICPNCLCDHGRLAMCCDVCHTQDALRRERRKRGPHSSQAERSGFEASAETFDLPKPLEWT